MDFSALAGAGINRVSLGLQALDNEALAFLGRAHDVDEGLGALDTRRGANASAAALVRVTPGLQRRADAARAA